MKNEYDDAAPRPAVVPAVNDNARAIGSEYGPGPPPVQAEPISVARTSVQQVGKAAGSGDEIAIDELTLGDVIGEGAYGVVRRGKWRGIIVAVKQLHSDRFEPKALADFGTEMTRMRSLLPHLNVVTFYGLCRDAKTNVNAIVTEFCAGGSLDSAVYDPSRKQAAASRWSVATKLRLAFGIAAGVAHLHCLLIVHRDLAARNVLLVKLNDELVPKIATLA